MQLALLILLIFSAIVLGDDGNLSRQIASSHSYKSNFSIAHNDNDEIGVDQCKHFKHAAPQTPAGRCAYIIEHCSNEEDSPGVLNYLQFYYCTMSNREGGQYYRWVALLIMTLDLLFLFIFIGTASADFFCPNLATISGYLNLPPDLAGVTFLALGNSAPDLFSSLVAIHYAGSVTMALGELLGAVLLVAGVVVAIVTLNARCPIDNSPCAVKLNGPVFLRDSGFLMLSIVMLGLITADGKLFWWEGLIMVTVYFIYVSTVIMMGVMRKRRLLAASEEETPDGPTRGASSPASLALAEDVNNESIDTFHQRKTSINSALGTMEAESLRTLELPTQSSNIWSKGIKRSKRQAGAIWLSIRTYFFPIITQWSERKLLGRIVAILNIIPTLALSLTTPCICEILHSKNINDKEDEKVSFEDDDDDEGSDEKRPLLLATSSQKDLDIRIKPDPVSHSFDDAGNFEHPRTVDVTNYRYILYTQSLLIPMFIAFATNSAFEPIGSTSRYLNGLFLGGCVGCFLLLVTFLTFRRISTRKLLTNPIISVIGFLMGILWIYFVAKEIVGLLKAFAKILDLSDALLGMTVFALGNSIGDLVSNVTMSRLGFPTMSIAASFAGPLMNILLTMGISGLLNWGGEPMALKITSNLIIGYFGAILMLLVMMASVTRNQFIISRPLSWSILILYFVVVTSSSIVDYLQQ